LCSDLLDGSVAVVTGAGRGIGAATAVALSASGAAVCLVDLDADASASTAAMLPGRVVTVNVDLTDPAAADTVIRRAVDAFGRLDIVVNNAGYNWDAALDRMSDEQFDAMVEVHLRVPFRMCRAAAPHLFDAAAEPGTGQPKVVNVSSLAASFGNAGAANYAAAKAGLIGLSRALANEWGPRGINVNVAAFGIISTRLAQLRSPAATIAVGRHDVEVGLSRGAMEAFGLDADVCPGNVALGRVGSTTEAANTILWLCSPLADYVTGQVIVASGGLRGGLQ
jgi:3-oxoacyl-[acyl-carrier protein] reductase